MYEGAIVHAERTVFARSLRRRGMQTLRLAALTHLHSLGFAELERLAPEAEELWVAAAAVCCSTGRCTTSSC